MIPALRLAMAACLTRASELDRQATIAANHAKSPLLATQSAAREFFAYEALTASTHAASHRSAADQICALVLTLTQNGHGVRFEDSGRSSVSEDPS